MPDLNGLHYEVRGEGKPVILLHGWVVGSSTWRETANLLADKGYKAILVDSRGHGDSPGVKEDSLLELLTDDFNSLVDELGLEEYCVVGHSAGGGAALTICDDRLKALVLVNTSYTLPANPAWFVLPSLVNACYNNSILKPAYDFFVNVGLNVIGEVYGKDREVIKHWCDDFVKADPDTVMREFKELSQYDMLESLSDIEVPTLIIAGSLDGLTPLKYSEVMHERIKDSELQVLPCGHASTLTHTKRVNSLLLDFLKRNYA